jgi:hypothetical protein
MCLGSLERGLDRWDARCSGDAHVYAHIYAAHIHDVHLCLHNIHAFAHSNAYTRTYVHSHAYTHTFTHSHAYTYTFAYSNTYTYVYSHVYTYTYPHAHQHEVPCCSHAATTVAESRQRYRKHSYFSMERFLEYRANIPGHGPPY